MAWATRNRRSAQHGGHKWRQLQARVYRTETHCGLCGGIVDKTLPWPHPMSKSVDHIISRKVAPHLALVRSNVQLAHLVHNQQKGDGEAKQERTPTSRAW